MSNSTHAASALVWSGCAGVVCAGQMKASFRKRPEFARKQKIDTSSLMAAFASLDVARKAVSAAIGIRDFNNAALELAKLNDALLNSQSQAFQLMGSLLAMQSERADLAKQVQELKEASLQRQSYTLFEISDRVYVYRSKVTSNGEGDIEPSALEPEHHICQRCFDKGVKVVLQRKFVSFGDIALACSNCGSTFLTDESMSNGVIRKDPSRTPRAR